MKLLVLHLSDIHLHEGLNESADKFPHIATAVQNEELNLTHAVIVLSGDLAFSGKTSEYQKAEEFLKSLVYDLKQRLKLPDIRIVMVPGNHDCDFSNEDSVREIVIEKVRAGKTPDAKMIECCCGVQANFFQFRDTFPGALPDRIHNSLQWDYRVAAEGNSVLFRCFNTAWMSLLREQQGGLHIPEAALSGIEEAADSYVAAVFHHPYNWLPSATYRRFRSFIEESSDLVLTGHEHEPDHYQKYSFSGEVNEYLEGAVFQEHGRGDRSGFHAAYIDLEAQQQRVVSFWWKDGRFNPSAHSDGWAKYKRGSRGGRREFEISEQFSKWLDDPGASYQHPAKPDLHLSDIYVLPNVKPFEVKKNSEFVYGSLIEGRDLLKTLSSVRRFIMFGRQQSGKTTLAKVLFTEFYNRDLTPVILSGDDLTQNHLKIDRLEKEVERSFGRQYRNPLLPAFQQLDSDKTVVMIDDFDHARLNAKGRLKLLEILRSRYERVIVFGDDVLKMEELAVGNGGAQTLSDFEQFEIVQFGHLLRSKLITQWYSLGSEFDADEADLSKRVHEAERMVTTMIGKNYLPSYPVFVLSLIQAHDSTDRPSTTAGTYGSLYEILITQALTGKSKAGNLDLKLTYLSELAFWMHSGSRKRISEDEWEGFHVRYCNKYKIRPSSEVLKDEFLAQGLLEFRDEAYSFRHAASYYYFAARYLRDNLSKSEIKELVLSLLTRLNKEEHASIWLFLTHLSKDPFLIDAIISHSKRIYASLNPANFEGDVKFLQGLGDKLQRIVLDDKKFEEVKEDRLRRLDSSPELPKEVDDIEESPEETNEGLKLIAELNLALRTLEVLGQLVKNFPGSLEGNEKFNLVEECYALGLRTVTMLFGIFTNDLEAFAELVVDRIVDRHPSISDREDLKRRVRQFMFWMIEAATFGMVKRISHAVGHSQLGETYEEVRRKYGTSAADVIDLSVSLDNLGFPEDEVKALNKKFRENVFCERLLKQLVVEHFYLFPTREATKQKICALLDIPMQDLRQIEAMSKEQQAPRASI